MGYQVTFVPTEEKMKSYKPYREERPTESMEDSFKYELISYCMKHHDDPASKIYRQIGFYLRCIASAAESEERDNAYFKWKEDENHEIEYCGWELAHDSYIDKDSIMQNTMESLFVLTDIVDTPSYFDNHEHFHTKLHDVEEDIDGFIEVIHSIAVHDIINDLDEFKKKYEDE